MLTALTRNLGHRITAMKWLQHQAGESTLPDLLFLQEVLTSRLGPLESTYDLRFRPSSPGRPSARTSVLGFRRALEIVVSDDVELFGGLGTYAACAAIEVSGQVIRVASVHTSPSEVEGALLADSSAKARRCERAPWWSDVLAAELLADTKGPLLIAGDLNEARAWDAAHLGHTCSEQFFDAIGESGITDITFRDWHGEERPTRRNPDYQLDRVLASNVIADSIDALDIEIVHDEVSDHAALHFSIA